MSLRRSFFGTVTLLAALIAAAASAQAQTPPGAAAPPAGPPPADAPPATPTQAAPGEQPAPAPAEAAPAAPAQPAPPQATAVAPPAPPPPQAPPPNAPTIYVAAPPPPPPAAPRGRHLHDGFYLRMSIGGGAMVADREYDTSTMAKSTLRGGGVALDLLIGGTPSPGFVIGGGLLLNGAADPSNETPAGTSDTEHETSASVFGPFIDGFPDPEGGFHIGGMLGLAGYAVRDDNEDFDEDTGGFGASAWIGYGGWVGSDWTLGGMLRLTAAATRRDFELPDGSDVVEDVSVGTLSILFTALYH